MRGPEDGATRALMWGLDAVKPSLGSTRREHSRVPLPSQGRHTSMCEFRCSGHQPLQPHLRASAACPSARLS